MRKFLQKIGSFKMEDAFSSYKNGMLNFITNHPELFCLSLLFLFCLFFLFLGIGHYPLMDVDETRYAVMARDMLHAHNWNNLMLNGEPFLEKPPLYFWFVGLSIKLFQDFSAFAVRFPIALISSFLIFFTYYVGKRIISRKFGVISALVLLTSMFFLIFSHVAILDMVLTVFMTSAIYCALLTQFCEEKNKKYYWWYFYLFIGMGFLAKGILAFAIPFVVIFIYSLMTRTLKDFFKPLNLIPGMIIFLAIIIPWHLVMYKEYGYEFVRQYFLMHHFARFMNSVSIGRERPFLYFVPVFLLGFLPWTFVFLSFIVDGIKKMTEKYKTTQGKLKEKLLALIEANTNEQKLLLFFVINFVVIFLVFSSSSTKLPTYILPIFPAASFLTGYYWWVGDEKKEHEKSTYNSTLLFSAILLLAATAALVGYYFLPLDLQLKMRSFNQVTIITIYMLSILLVLRLNTKRALSIFSGYILTMVFVITLSVSQIFNLVYAGGENEIVNYSSISANYKGNQQLVTFDFAVKPSVMIEYEGKVNFLTDPDFKQLDKLLEYKDGPTFVIVKNKNFKNNDKYKEEITKRLALMKVGDKYSLYVKR